MASPIETGKQPSSEKLIGNPSIVSRYNELCHANISSLENITGNVNMKILKKYNSGLTTFLMNKIYLVLTCKYYSWSQY